MLEEAGEDLFEGALPVAEPEAAVRRDRVQLAVGELRDPAEGGAGGESCSTTASTSMVSAV